MAFERLQPFLPERIDVNAAVDRATSVNLWCEKGSKVRVQDVAIDWLAEPKEGGEQVDALAVMAQAKALSAVAGKRKKKAPAEIPNPIKPRRKKKGG